MYEGYVRGLLTIALAFIAIFITLYAYLFMSRSTSHKDRRPWDFLFAASIAFLIFEFTSLLTFIGVISFARIDLVTLSKIFEFIYSGLVLLAFISQHDLILKSHLILISRKEKKEK
ncbi:hypothetical protein D6789_04865 [Candidatus Woesearchaeota archaeon]|nr:MAG: hypothetical protein D6789_04865 [Candidatus Woesearchaeota archaeon]